MAAAYIKIFHDFLEKTARLKDDEVGRLVKALIVYSRDGVEQDLPGNEDFLFPVFKAQVDADKAAYEEISAKRKAAGSRGGKAKVANASTCKQEVIHDNNNDSCCNIQKSSKSVVVGNSLDTTVGTEDSTYKGIGLTKQVVALAEDRAAMYGHDGDKAYILAILRDWVAQGVKTVEDAQRVIAEHKAKTSAPATTRNDHGYQHHNYTEEDFGENFYFNPFTDTLRGERR